jgi:ribosomal protein S6
MVKHYEGMFLCHNKEARKETEYLVEHVKGLIEKVGGTVVKIAKWDERRLAYPVKGVTHGVYILTYFSADSGANAKLATEVRLSSQILRHLTLAREQIPEGEIETFQAMQTRLSAVNRTDDGLDPLDGDLTGGPRMATSMRERSVSDTNLTDDGDE